MMPVKLQPEPDNFTEKVKIPGQKFLSETSNPKSDDWKGKNYWTKILPYMREVYNKTCAYSASWISHGTGRHSVEHFIPKSQNPQLAYEWTNYRYVSARFNSRKGTRSIVDPFKLSPADFILDFPSCLIRPNPDIAKEKRYILCDTIKFLQLNDDEDLVEERREWYQEYMEGRFGFEHLKKMMPFLAFEIKRITSY